MYNLVLDRVIKTSLYVLTNTTDGLGRNGGTAARRHSTVVRALSVDYAGAQEQIVASANVIGKAPNCVEGKPWEKKKFSLKWH